MAEDADSTKDKNFAARIDPELMEEVKQKLIKDGLKVQEFARRILAAYVAGPEISRIIGGKTSKTAADLPSLVEKLGELSESQVMQWMDHPDPNIEAARSKLLAQRVVRDAERRLKLK